MKELSLKEEIMLVLSRKVGEKIVIGGNITVTLVRLAGNRVSIGVDAPADIRIVRGEVDGSRAMGGELPSSKASATRQVVCGSLAADSPSADSLSPDSLSPDSLSLDAGHVESLAP